MNSRLTLFEHLPAKPYWRTILNNACRHSDGSRNKSRLTQLNQWVRGFLRAGFSGKNGQTRPNEIKHLRLVMNAVAVSGVVGLAACGGGGSSGGEPAQPPATPAPVRAAVTPAPVLLEMYGDSTTWGSNGTPDQTTSEPEWLRQLVPSNVTIKNEGVRGAIAAQLYNGTDGQHLPWTQQMANSTAKIVTLNYALNDSARVSLADYTETVRALVDVAKAAGKIVVLQEPNPSCDPAMVALPLYVKALNEIAVEKSVRIVHQYGAYADWKAHEADCTHPDRDYYKIKAQATYEVIRDLF